MNTGKIGLIAAALLAAGCSGSGGDNGDWMAPSTPSGVDSAGNPVPGGSNVAGVTPTPAGTTPGAGGGVAGGGVTPSTPGNGDPTAPGTGLPPVDGVPPSQPQPGVSSSCSPGIPATSQIPRLTNAEYERTVYDLLGTPSPGLLATEQAGAITKSILDAYRSSATALAATVMADPALKANFMKCTPAGDGAACLSETIVDFGRRAYRRPLTSDEIAGYEELIARGAELTATGSADEVAELILATFLQSPSFLQRAELSETPDGSGAFKLSPHEVASRLSYMLWGSMPDDTLLTAADAGELQTKEQVLAQARRMIADEKVRDVAAEFHREYLHLSLGGRWDSARKDAAMFPDFDEQVVPDMINETEQLFADVFSSGGTFQELLTTNVAYVTERTAKLYGLPNPEQYGTELTRVELENRPGFLTRVGFLAAFANQNRTNPILRGTFITKDVLGISIGNPDPAAANTPLPNDPSLDTVRKRVDAMTSESPCSACHTPLINPPGFVMEAFDASGAYQTTEKDTGAPIDTVADVLFTRTGEPETVTDPVALVTRIAESPSAHRFYAAKWIGYAYERQLTGPDQCVADDLAARVTAGGYSIQDLLVDLTQTDSFLTRALEVTQ